MKKILLFVIAFTFSTVNLQACEGDCVVCHPKLVQENGKLDKDHEILITCKTCHTQEEMEKIDMGNGCGQDCWDCHDIKKVTASNVPEHQGLQKCIDCHVTIDKSLFGGTSAPAFNEMPTLDELMRQSSSVDALEEDSNKVMDELNKSEEIVSTESLKITKGQEEVEMNFWNKISNFFQNLWQKIVNILS